MAEFSNTYIFGFSAAVCILCSVALASTAMALQERQELNKSRDAQSKVLQALSLPEDGSKLEGPAIDKLYADRVRVLVIDRNGNEVAGKTEADVKAEQDAAHKEHRDPQLLAVYERIDSGKPVRYGIPLKGVGLWGPIGGFLAVDSDGSTVTGATFNAPKETPGLGAEIQATPFTSQWPGKKLTDGGKTVPVDVVKGKAAEICPGRVEHCVDGISGATITSRGVDAMVEAATATYDPFLLKIRQGG